MANDQHQQCKDCGCVCTKCCNKNDQDVQLHIEIENLKQKLVERDTHIAAMETNVLNEANKFPNGEFIALQDELSIWQDKYKRLYDAHKRIQRVNQGLEDKLLRLVDSCETEKCTLTKDVATLSHKLAEANYAIKKLTEDNERYKEDVALAIQFLQCKQGNFVSQKLDSLPNEVQAKVSMYVGGKKSPQEKKVQPEVKSIKVPIPTFPPTAMVYSIPKNAASQEKELDESDNNQSVDIVSAAIMAKVLEERERERALAKHCDTCTCSKGLKIIHDTTTHCVGTQTGESKHSVCLRCNGEMDSISGVKIVKGLVTNKSNNVPIYTNDYEGNLLTSEGDDRIIRPNVVKVEPNNYLKENISICSNESQKSSFLSKNSSSPGFQVANCDLSAKDSSKGPRYCSVRLQSGSKNILLDNVHNNVAPVLYTHPNDKKVRKGQNNTKVHHRVVSQNSNINIPGYSSDEANSFNLLEDSLQNQQRVAEWIQTNQNNGSYTDNSKLAAGENNKNDYFNTIDPIRYAEMENNVKKFLLGESQSEFFKKVAIGKQNYQNLRGNANAEVDENAQHLNSETQI